MNKEKEEREYQIYKSAFRGIIVFERRDVKKGKQHMRREWGRGGGVKRKD